MANKKLTMDYSPWYRHVSMANKSATDYGPSYLHWSKALGLKNNKAPRRSAGKLSTCKEQILEDTRYLHAGTETACPKGPV